MNMVSRAVRALALLIGLAWWTAGAPAMAQSHFDVVPGYKIDGVAPIYLYNPAGAAQFIASGTLASATSLTVPPGATLAIICVETAGVRYRDDGARFYGSIAGTTLTVAPTSVTLGTIAIGQTISDPGGVISAGTKITAGSGSSWTVNNSQTVAKEIINAVTPPTASVGIPAVGTSSAPYCFPYGGLLTAIQFIAISGSPTMDISYYYSN